MKHRGVTCEKCGVEVIESKVRRTRMGHIELASPVCHVWFFKGSPSRIGALLDLPVRDIERIVYFESFVVTDPKNSGLEEKEVLTEDKYKKKQQELGENSFEAKIGAEAVKELLSRVDVDDLLIELKRELSRTVSVQKKLKLAKRLRVVEAFRKSGNRPEWMVLDVLPVIPPELRPLVPLDGGRFATSDLNDLYRRVINRNNRLRKLLDLSAPEIIVRNEKRMLQEAVDALFDNGRRGRLIRSSNKHPLKSLSDIIKGKQGRFRQNLLGKRVDYSGRSVIVAGPHLKMHQCGIPKMMAIELFKPFLYYKLEKEKGIASTIKEAKRMVEERNTAVWDVLEEVINEHPVLLNRAPTLHRLGIQAFEPILVEGKAIQLHPLVCPAFNADFDGDQMAVHVPLSFEAQLEARALMLSSYNILSPAHGKPLAVPTQDMVLGIYYLTRPMRNAKGSGKTYSSPEEVIIAYDQNKLSLHAEIKVRLDGKIVQTTTGRIIIRNILPKGIDFEEVNKVLGKKEITALVDLISKKLGNWHCVNFLDDLKSLGFRYSTKAGYSICIDDLLVPKEKQRLVNETHKEIEAIRLNYEQGDITPGERYNKIIDAWSATNDKTTEYLMKTIESVGGDASKTAKRDRFYNTIFVFANSGARSSKAQISQLSGMRGLMAKPSGEIIETPITASFREGLTVLQFFDSTHGARKGLADTALKTANSGYLTRRLVDVAQDVIISEEDCGTINGVEISALTEQNEIIEPLGDRILGRFTMDDLFDPMSDELLVPANTLIMEEEIKVIEKAGIDRVKVRSVLTCDSAFGVCKRCYGLDLATRRVAEIGEAVGTIAAQSIGEPGTQLTMRTFHIGGAASASKEASSHHAKFGGKVRYVDIKTVRNAKNVLVVTSNNGKLELLDHTGRSIETYPITYGTRLFVENGEDLKQGTVIAEWDPHVRVVLTDIAGKVEFVDLVKGENIKEEVNPATSISSWVVSAVTAKDKRQPTIRIIGANGVSKNFPLPGGSILSVEEGVEVLAGDIISKTARAAQKTRDITVGLPRIAELFEARKAKEIAIVAEIDGEVSIEEGSRSSQKVTIENKDTGDKRTYSIPIQRGISVREGDYVKAGDSLTEGLINPHDILAINGVEHLQKHLVDSIQEVYRKQGVSINDKHIEVIVRQMLKKTQIEDPGDSDFMPNEEVYKADYARETERLREAGLRPPVGRPIMQGITKAALNTESFISAASFQETTRVLTDAACSGKTDQLKGLKENVIMGKLIPAGTGSKHILAQRFKFTETE
jgi:DNA-directed RNA polymerase subunit beta'